MAKQSLANKDAALESMMIETFMAGCNGVYPKSHSDLEWGIRALMKMFDCKRLPVARDLDYGEHGPLRSTVE